MMSSFLHSRKDIDYSSVVWHRSRHYEQVSFAVRRPSLAQRIALTSRVRELTLKHEFLQAGDITDRLAASLSELFVRKLYLEWGLVEIKGLKIDGEQACTSRLIASGPEDLTEEIICAVKAEAGLTEDERKNS
jgi:hypothetical protein